MPSSRILLAAVLTLALSATPGRAGEAAKANLDILRDTIRANKKALVAANLTLSDEEAANFWPLYDRYQTELKPVQDRAVKIIEEYTASFHDLSNEKAMKLADDWLSAEGDRVKVRRTYLGEFAKVLVITHLDELKDVFGSQIRVTKDPVEGSRLQICS